MSIWPTLSNSICICIYPSCVPLTSILNHALRKLAMTQVELDRTNEKANEAESKIQELEEQMNVVGQNMKTLELSETNALKRHEDYEEKIR